MTKKKNDDNPTIGIVLCTKTDEDIRGIRTKDGVHRV